MAAGEARIDAEAEIDHVQVIADNGQAAMMADGRVGVDGAAKGQDEGDAATRRRALRRRLGACFHRQAVVKPAAICGRGKGGGIVVAFQTEGPAQNATFHRIVAEARAQQLGAGVVAAADDALAPQQVGDHRADLAAAGEHRQVVDGKGSRRNVAREPADIVDVDIDR